MGLGYYLKCQLIGYLIYLQVNLLSIGIGITLGTISYVVYGIIRKKTMKNLLVDSIEVLVMTIIGILIVMGFQYFLK